MTSDDLVIEDLGEWDWSLVVTPDADVAARKPIKHDGVLTFSTEDRPTSSRARSQTRLTVEAVIERYVSHAATKTPKIQLLEDVVAALESVRDVGDMEVADVE